MLDVPQIRVKQYSKALKHIYPYGHYSNPTYLELNAFVRSLFLPKCWSECNFEFRIGYDNVCKASAGSTMVTSVEIVICMELFCYKAYFLTAWWLPQKAVSHKEASKWTRLVNFFHSTLSLNPLKEIFLEKPQKNLWLIIYWLDKFKLWRQRWKRF